MSELDGLELVATVGAVGCLFFLFFFPVIATLLYAICTGGRILGDDIKPTHFDDGPGDMSGVV